jgi:FkbM family methyltransferase
MALFGVAQALGPERRRGRLAAGLALAGDKLRETGVLFRRYLGEIPRLGFVAATTLFLAELSARRPLSRLFAHLAPSIVTLRPAGYRAPLSFRRGETDSKVIRHVLVREEYRDTAALSDVDLIVDCGANIGVTSYYLLHRYPSARLVAIEPDDDNFDLCRRNLAAFGSRVVLVHAALWPRCEALRIDPASRALGAWGLRVEPVEPDAGPEAAEVYGLTLMEILRLADARPPIDLLKIDIEGAEADVFRAPCDEWLDRTRHIAIELHGTAPQAAFDRALAPYCYHRHESGELTLVQDLTRAAR